MRFVGEAGLDTGGLRKELWRLIKQEIADQFFVGTLYNKTFKSSISALQVGTCTCSPALGRVMEKFLCEVLVPLLFTFTIVSRASRDVHVVLSLVQHNYISRSDSNGASSSCETSYLVFTFYSQ